MSDNTDPAATGDSSEQPKKDGETPKADLDEADLNVVTGGLNPQPLPPQEHHQ